MGTVWLVLSRQFYATFDSASSRFLFDNLSFPVLKSSYWLKPMGRNIINDAVNVANLEHWNLTVWLGLYSFVINIILAVIQKAQAIVVKRHHMIFIFIACTIITPNRMGIVIQGVYEFVAKCLRLHCVKYSVADLEGAEPAPSPPPLWANWRRHSRSC